MEQKEFEENLENAISSLPDGQRESFLDSIQSEPFYSIYDQTHVLDLGISLQWKNFKFSTGWKYRTGLASLPEIRVQLLSGLQINGQFYGYDRTKTRFY